ncbi:hypothetical protein [Sphingobium terrigena]|nr:hypothetical protein [Sphingobium terrigena]
MEPQTYRFAWQGIGIEATYTPLRWGVIDHLEIRSVEPRGAPLSISSTGYRSHFHQPGTIEAHGGDVVAQIVSWLDDEAGKPDWLE